MGRSPFQTMRRRGPDQGSSAPHSRRQPLIQGDKSCPIVVNSLPALSAAPLPGLTVPSAFAAQAISPLPKKWDMTADVVVLGFGGAGATTAIVAAQNGAKVIVLEKNPQDAHISNTRMSGGIFHCPFKDGDPKALKEYAKAMVLGREHRVEGRRRNPRILRRPRSGVGRSVALEPRIHAEPRSGIHRRQPAGLRQGQLPELPGRQGMPLQRVSCDLHEAHEEFQPGFLQVPEERDEFRRSLLALP